MNWYTDITIVTNFQFICGQLQALSQLNNTNELMTRVS